MALTPGYWPSTYWADDYWHDTYWQHHGVGLPTANMHLIGANLSMTPNSLPDVNTNTLFEGSIEAKEKVYTITVLAQGTDVVSYAFMMGC